MPRQTIAGDDATAIASVRVRLDQVNQQSGVTLKIDIIRDVIDDWRRTPQGWRLARETVVSAAGNVDVPSVVMAIKSQQGAGGGSAGGAAGGATVASVQAGQQRVRMMQDSAHSIQQEQFMMDDARNITRMIYGN